MGRIIFTPASEFTLERVTQAFNRAFMGYYLPMTQTPASLTEMMRENDVRLEVSIVALLDEYVVGVSLLAIRERRGWIAGMGIDPLWRRQGLGRLLLRAALERLSGAGARIAQLEALAVNTPALTLYSRFGFQDTRELSVYQGLLRFSAQNALPTDVPNAGIRPLEVKTALRHFSEFHMVQPAWQREERTLAHVQRHLSGLGLWMGNKLCAYLLYLAQPSGYILYDAGSAAATGALRQAQLSALLRRLANGRMGTFARAINVPPGDPLGDTLDALNCPIIMRQREMALSLGAGEPSQSARGDR